MTPHKITVSKLAHAVNFEEIVCIEDLETVSEEVLWQTFERLTAFIFEKNDVEVTVNTVKTCHKNKRQYDIIARKSDQTYLIECKKWAGSRYRLSALKNAVEHHKERTTFYKNITNEDAIPLFVTLIEEEIRFNEGVPLVPVLKLNCFLTGLDQHVDGNSSRDYVKDPSSGNDREVLSPEISTMAISTGLTSSAARS